MQQQSKIRMALLGATFMAVLISTPRLLIALSDMQVGIGLGPKLDDVLFGFVMMFAFSWTVLTYNLSWKYQLQKRFPNKPLLTQWGGNFVILLIFVSTVSLLRSLLLPGRLDIRLIAGAATFGYLVIQLILILVVQFWHLTVEHQQQQLEKEKLKQEALIYELEALKNQLNPHFLFNLLGSLKLLIRENPQKASLFVDRFSSLLRQSFLHTENNTLSIEEELEILSHYLFLQKERFRDKLQVNINVPEGWSGKFLPALSLQSLVENALKHNVISHEFPLKVSIYAEGDWIVVENKKRPRLSTAEGTKTGLDNLSKRFKLLQLPEIKVEESGESFVVKLPVSP